MIPPCRNSRNIPGYKLDNHASLFGVGHWAVGSCGGFQGCLVALAALPFTTGTFRRGRRTLLSFNFKVNRSGGCSTKTRYNRGLHVVTFAIKNDKGLKLLLPGHSNAWKRKGIWGNPWIFLKSWTSPWTSPWSMIGRLSWEDIENRSGCIGNDGRDGRGTLFRVNWARTLLIDEHKIPLYQKGDPLNGADTKLVQTMFWHVTCRFNIDTKSRDKMLNFNPYQHVTITDDPLQKFAKRKKLRLIDVRNVKLASRSAFLHDPRE